ncbi:hypothetical protein KXS07_18420 [Inquilinus limosus]|uniref:hypothetical protein n=1 Tax=Inquilinus limosus TaxID=171674 RepID=UPI003F184A41
MSESKDIVSALGPDDPFEAFGRQLQERRDRYERDVLNTRPFQDGLRYLQGIARDLLIAQTCIRLQGMRFSAADDYLLFRFAPHIVESTLAITSNARDGLQNAARRELRFLLEAAVKLSSRDVHPDARTLEARLAGLDDRDKRFEDYVAELPYFDGSEKPDEANAAILSLYSQLSRYVHATGPQFKDAMIRERRDESAGMESVATLNRFNKLAFQVFDLVLVRLFFGLGLSLAGDVFTGVLDDFPRWKFHKGRFVARMSRCFDYKHERRVRRGEI